MSLLVLIWFIIGMIMVVLEPDYIDKELFKKEDKTGIIINSIQALVHYLRVGLTGPLYLIEDILINVDNQRKQIKQLQEELIRKNIRKND